MLWIFILTACWWSPRQPSISTVLVLACTCVGIHPGRVEPASPNISDVSWVVRTPRPPVPASLHLLAFQLKPRWACPILERRSVRSSHTHPPFWFESRWRDGDTRDRSLIGRGVLTTPPFGPFCRTVDAQSTTQPWHTDPLTPLSAGYHTAPPSFDLSHTHRRRGIINGTSIGEIFGKWDRSQSKRTPLLTQKQ